MLLESDSYAKTVASSSLNMDRKWAMMNVFYAYL